MLVGRLFHARTTVTRNDRSPMVLSRVRGTIRRGQEPDQDAIKVNNLIAAHWLNILYKRGVVSNGVIAISATLTSRMQLPVCTAIYRHLSTQKTGQRIVSTSIQLTFQCGVLCNRSCIVRSSG